MKIKTKGLKGQDREVDIDKLTLLVGPNESGKSTIVDGIRLGVLGFVPSLGKRNEDTAALMREREASVEIEHDGKLWNRKMKNTGKKLTGSVECAWLKNAKPAEHASAILHLFGKEEIDVAEIMDIRQLLDATPAQRAARIEDLLSTGRTSTHEMALRVAELTVRRLAGKVDAEIGDGWKSLIPILSKSLQSYLKDLAGDVEAHVKEAGIGGALTWANAWKKEETNRLAERKKAAKELEGRIAEIPESAETDLAGLKEQRDSLQRELGAAREKIETAKKNASEIESVKEQIANTEKGWAENHAARKEAEKELARIPEIEKEIHQLEEHLKSLIEPLPGEYPEADELDKQAQKKDSEAKQIRVPEIPSMDREKAKVSSLRTEVESVKNSAWSKVIQIADEIKEIGEARNQTEEEDSYIWSLRSICKDLAKRLREIATNALGRDPGVIMAQLNAAEEELATLQKLCDEAEGVRKAAEAKYSALTEEAQELREKAQEIRSRGARDYAKILGAYNEEKQSLEEAIRDKSNERDLLNSALLTAEQNSEQAKERIDFFRSQLDTLGESGCGDIKDNRIELQDKIDDLTKRITELEQVAGERTALAGIVKDIENAGAAVDTSKALEWALKRAREEEVTQAGGPLVAHMKKFLEGAGRSEVPFFRAEKRRVDIGWRTEDDHEVLIQALSGGGWALFTAALTSAVIALRGAPLRVLLVDAGKADGMLRMQIVKGISAVSDTLTHAIVETPSGLASLPEGWTALEIAG